LRTVACLFLVLATLAPLYPRAAGESAEQLAMAADRLLDTWDGEAEILEAAGKLLEQALQAEPDSSLAMAVEARRVLHAGTEEGAIRPSAMRTADGLLNRAVFSPSPHPRAWALRAHLYHLAGDRNNTLKYVRPAQKERPDDPWVKFVLAKHTGSLGDIGAEVAILEEALAAGFSAKRELKAALDTMLPFYLTSRLRDKADAIYTRIVALQPREPMIRADYARRVIEYFIDFDAGERLARESLAISDSPHARQTLSIALYGRWAQAAKDGKGLAVVEKLYQEATANDPEGRQIPGCMAYHPPLRFVFERLEAKRFRREQMHRC
jgi:predicted Zn-dependent protease